MVLWSQGYIFFPHLKKLTRIPSFVLRTESLSLLTNLICRMSVVYLLAESLYFSYCGMLPIVLLSWNIKVGE